ncbi:MAG: NADH-quinone oxidoreductase subunit H [Candidatus Hermodarchaeota archaeon]
MDIITELTTFILNILGDLLGWTFLADFRGYIQMAIMSVLLLVFILLNILAIIWLERKMMGRLMDRPSTQVGPYGLFQLIADFFKMLGKEILLPQGADKLGMYLALFMIVVTAIAAYMVIPVTGFLFVSDPPMGFLLVFAIFSLYPISVALLGWSSNSKYSLLGGFRSAAQLLSYEIPLVLCLGGAIVITNAAKPLAERSFSLFAIVNYQAQPGFLGIVPLWFTFLLPIGALIFTITTIAEAERIPFDLPEGESELIMGWRTELSAITYMYIMMAEYIHMFMGAALAVLIFFGGWTMPFGLDQIIHPAVWFIIKVYVLVAIEVWIRGALPRIRIDQLLDIGWKILVPLAIVNLLLAAVISINLEIGYIITWVVIAFIFIFVFRGLRKDPDIPSTYQPTSTTDSDIGVEA